MCVRYPFKSGSNQPATSETRTTERVREMFQALLICSNLCLKRYVESLESRLEKMETLLQRVRRTTELSGYDISSNVALS